MLRPNSLQDSLQSLLGWIAKYVKSRPSFAEPQVFTNHQSRLVYTKAGIPVMRSPITSLCMSFVPSYV